MVYIKRIFDHLYMLDVGFPELPETFASYFLIGEKLAIIDPGPSRFYKNVLEAVKELGFNYDDVKYILLTHIHLDHAGSVGHLAEYFKNAKILVHPKGVKHLIDPKKLNSASKEVLGENIINLIGDLKPVPSELIEEARNYLIYELGNEICFVAIFTPGHASHHVSYFTDANDILFAGDSAGHMFKGKLSPSTPTPFRFDLAMKSLKEMMVLRPLHVAYTHFGVYERGFDRLMEYYGKLYYWRDVILEHIRKGASKEEALEFVIKYDHTSREVKEILSVNPFFEKSLEHSFEGFYQYIVKYEFKH